MSHIVIDARIINSSTGTYVKYLLKYLQQIDRKNHYTVLVPTKDKDYWQPDNPNFCVHTVDIANYSFAEQIIFPRILRRLQPDLVHFCMPQQPILYRGASVTTVHDLTLLKTYNSDKNWLVFHIKQLVGRIVFKIIGRTNKYIITPSNYTRQAYATFAKIPLKKIITTYEAADVAVDKTEPYPLPFKRFLLYVGQQSDYKNIPRLAEAHQLLLQQNPDLGLVLVGKLNASVKKNQLLFTEKKYQNIVFTDFIEDTQRDWLYQNCAAYVFPSLMEGFGLPGLEAMGYGAPVISSDFTCLPEIYDKAALYFNPENSIELAQTIQQLLDDDKLRAELIQLGFSRVADFSWKRTAEQTLAVYNQALEN